MPIVSVIGSFFAWLSGKILAKSILTGIYVTVTTMLIAGHIAMMAFFGYAILFIFNRYNDFMNLLSTFDGFHPLLAITINILQSVGIINAFNDVFSIFSPFIISYLGYRVALVVYHSWKITSDELFKIGVLIQQ